MLTGALSMFVRSGVLGSGLEISTKIAGFAWIPLWISLTLWTPAFIKSAGQLFLICSILSLVLPFKILMDLAWFPGANQVFGYISGIGILICGLLGLWLAAVMIVNKGLGKNVFPSLKPFYKK
jgi:hypothetical protein